jgi:glycosyltransferase involved in cell wall biosynthesis
MPKITVITACLNASRTLEQTLASVLSQNYPGLEYIVVDGGSADGTLDIIKKYEDRLSRVISEPDNGIYDAFNKGLRMASGEIIGILNADDFYAPWALETVARAYKDNPECDVLFGKVAVVDEAKRSWKVYPLGSAANLPDSMSISHPAIFVPKRTYDRWGLFDDSYKITGDWDYMLRIFLDGAVFSPVDEVLTAFRLDGVSGALSPRHLAENRVVYEKRLDEKTARGKIIKMYLKYCVRRVMKATGVYNLYASYRDRRIFCVEASGEYAGDSASMWAAVRGSVSGLGVRKRRIF